MLKKTITYIDYNENSITEDFYFNLSKAELAEMELSTPGGFATKIQKMVNTQDGPSLMKYFKEIILKAYGVKSDDGKRFIKSEKISEEFAQTEAYSELYLELLSDADKAAEFIQGILPKMDANVPAPVLK